MRILVLSSGVGYGGRGKAMLSLCDYLSQEFSVTVCSDFNESLSSEDQLMDHHGIFPDVDWVDGDFLSHDGDVVVGFDSRSNGVLSSFNSPTVAYCRRGISDWADEYWTPSEFMANRHNAWLRERDLEDNCYPVYPIWYLEKPDSIVPFEDRIFDVLVHDRKEEGVGRYLSEYSVHYTSNYSWDELTEIYQSSRIYLFPNKSRFEPLGLMAIEAAAHGCHLSLTRNCGVSEIYPHHVYRRPEKAIPDILERGEVSDLLLPESPTDPIERLNTLLS